MSTNDRILLATSNAHGDYRATKSALGKWCTAAIVEAASSVTVPQKFSAPLATWRDASREEATEFLCGWAHSERLRLWSLAYQASRDAAIAAMPEALAELGAAL